MIRPSAALVTMCAS